MSNTLAGLWIKKIGMNRGKPRLWFDCLRIAAAGLLPGVRFNLEHHGKGLKLSASEDGRYKVASKDRNGKTVPVLDLDSREKLGPIYDEQVVRIVITEKAMFILPLASEIAKKERLERLQRKLASGEALSVGSVAHGAGVLSHAAHAGFRDAGVPVKLAFNNEIDEGYMAQSLDKNPVNLSSTINLCAPMQEIIQDPWLMQQLPVLEVFEVALPCSGASKAGRSKRGLDHPESHPEVGHLVHAALTLIQRTQPAIVVLENVEGYSTSASASILRNQLRDMGYNVREHVLDSTEWGCLEKRVRWAFTATTSGLAPLDVVPNDTAKPHNLKLGDLLEDIPLDDPRWRTLSYLKDKEVRDKAAGKGFAMQTVNADSTSVPTIRKGYAKGGSTDPFVQHPTNPDLLRKLTVREHATLKGVNAVLVEGLSESVGHQVLGQGIAYAPFRALFCALGELLKSLRANGPSWSDPSAGAMRLAASIG